MTQRLEIAPGVFMECGDTHQRILDQISDPVAQKILIVRWAMRGEIEPAQATLLLVDNGLESA